MEHTGRRSGTVLRWLGVVVAGASTLAVVVAAFAISFAAIEAVGVAAGIDAGIAWLLPAAVDGAMLVATITAVVLRTAERVALYPWVVVIAGAGISVVCNAAHARPVPGAVMLSVDMARAVSAIPSVILFLSVHLLITLVLHVLRQPADAEQRPGHAVDIPTAPDPVPAQAGVDLPDPDLSTESPDGAVPAVQLGTDEARALARTIAREHPDMTPTQIAGVVGRSERTVKRYLEPALNGTTPEPAATAASN